MVAIDVATISHEIADRDAMYTDEDHYFRVARSALTCIDAGMMVAGISTSEVRRVLDLACGHGRVMRALRARFEDAEIVGCDIDRDGVDFCARTFGAVPVLADEDPRRTMLDGPFDIIWCGSLLTHLPRQRFSGLLERLFVNLAAEGIAVLTTHGRNALARIESGRTDYGLASMAVRRLVDQVAQSGFGYEDYDGVEEYGISVSTPEWLVRHIADELPEARIVSLMEAGWDDHQDVLVIGRG